VCFRVWKEGFENNNSNEMMARGVIGTTNITRLVTIIVGKMVRQPLIYFYLQHLHLFTALSSHPTIGKE
jgi:hypothetical protein